MTLSTRRRAILDEDQIKEIAAAGAEEGARRVLLGLGVDVEQPLEMQRDFAWMREKREAGKKLIDAGKLALVASIIGAVVTFGASVWGGLARALTGMGGTPPQHP